MLHVVTSHSNVNLDGKFYAIGFWAQFHKRVIAMTVLNAGNFVWMAKWVTFCDICFHYTLDHLLVNR